MKEFHILPNDPFYENINAYLKVWLYESWLHDQELEAQKLKNQAILIGSFSNLEMAQKMVQAENPKAVDANWEETSQKLHENIIKTNKTAKKRKKRKVVS